MRKLRAKLTMTSRCATLSRHITYRGGIYWRCSFIHLICTSGTKCKKC